MRLALSMLTACGFAFLTACGSGFSGSSNSAVVGNVVLTPNSGQVNEFFIVPGGSAPLGVSAVAYQGSRQFNTIIPDVTYTWSARFVNPATDLVSVSTYNTGSAPNGFKPCPAMPSTTPTVPILMQGGAGTQSSLYPGYVVMAPGATATSVFVGPVPGVSPPYCLVVQATSTRGSVIGTATAIVSLSP